MPASPAELTKSMHRIAEALQYMRGPTGEVIYIGQKIPQIAWHLARAGLDVHPNRAVIKPRLMPDRPGQFTGLIDWVPVDSPDTDPAATPAPIRTDTPLDLDALTDAIPWHVKTRIEGRFT